MPDYPEAIVRNSRYKFGESPSVRDWIDPDPDTGFDLPTGVKIIDGVIAAGAITFVSATAGFLASHVGQLIVVRGAGTNGTYLRTSIASYIGPTSVSLADPAGSTVAAADAAFGPDSLPAFLEAVVSGYALIPRGVYLVSGSITHDERLHIAGRTRGSYRIDDSGNVESPCMGVGVEIWSTSVDPVFFFQSDLRDAAYDINCSLSFENLAIYAKRPIKLNQERTDLPAGKYQGRLLHVAFSNVELHGEYQSGLDANWDTAVEPTWPEMIGYGIGIEAHQVFGLTTDEYCIIQHNGIGIYLRDSDECVIKESRVTQNGHNICIRGTITSGYGNINKIYGCALGANKRVGCIRQEQTLTTIIHGNYFETYTDACRFLWSVNNISTRFLHNRIDNPNYPPFAGHTVTTPIVFCDDWHSILFAHNVVNVNGYPVPPMSFGYTYWAPTFNINQYNVLDNNLHWPTPGTKHLADGTVCPTLGGVLTKALDPLRFAADNIPADLIAGSLTFPFEVNATTGRWATIKQAAVSELVFRFYLQSQMYRRYVIRFTVRNAVGGTTGGVGGVTVNYVGAATTVIGSWALNPTATANVEIKLIDLAVPAGEVTNGYWEVHLDTQTVQWEEAVLLPIDDYSGFVQRQGAEPADTPITGVVATATGNANQPSVPIYDIVDVNRPYGDEVGSWRISRLGTLAKKLFIGWADSIGADGGGYLQAIKSAVGTRPLSLNPSGGPILIRTAADDGANDIQSTGFAKHTGDLLITAHLTGQGSVTFSSLINGFLKADGAGNLGIVAVGLTNTITVVTNVSTTSNSFNLSGGGAASALTGITLTTFTLGFTAGLRTT